MDKVKNISMSTRFEENIHKLQGIKDNLHILSYGIDLEVDWEIKRNAMLLLFYRHEEIVDDMKEILKEMMEKNL